MFWWLSVCLQLCSKKPHKDATFQDHLGFLVAGVSPPFFLDWGLQTIKSAFLANSIRIAIIPTTSRWEHEEGGEEGLVLPIDVGFPGHAGLVG